MLDFHRQAARGAMRALLGIGGLVLCHAQAAGALDPGKAITQYTLSVWQTEDGLPQDSLTAVAQAEDGALWLGTPAGLVRFDGLEFRPVSDPLDRPPSSRYVTGLAKSPSGALWASMRDGLLEIGGKSKYYGAGQAAIGNLLGLDFDADGGLWVASERGLLRFTAGKLRPFARRGAVASEAALSSIVRGSHDRLWAATDSGLLAVAGDSARLYTRRDGLPTELVSAVLEDRAGRVWVGTPRGLLRLDGDGFEVPAGARALAGLWIRCLLEDRDGNLWIGTRGAGVHRLVGDELATLTSNDGLPSEFIRQILEDRDGSLWFATAGGLTRLMEGAVTPWTEHEGLPKSLVWSLYEDPRGDLWIGTNGAGVARFGAGGPVATGFDDRDLAGLEVRTFLTDRHGTLWIGTGGAGILRVTAGRKQWIDVGAGLPSGWVLSLLEDRHGRVWAGTGKGLVRFAEGRVAETLGGTGGLPSPVVRSLAEDENGTIWVGTAAGLARLEHDRLVPVERFASLDGLRVHCILPQAGGSVWVATDGGLVHLVAGRATRITLREGLPDDMLYWLLDDGVENLWMSTDRGVVRLPKRQVAELERGERATLSPLLLDRSDGMRGTECNSGHPGGVRRRDGTLCFATTVGMACVDPVRLRSFEDPPPVTIEQVLVDGVPAEIAGSGAERAVVVPAVARRVEIRYAGVALAAPEKVAFRHRLAGFDPAWVEAGRARAAHFTSLPSGHLRFAVESRRGNGSWSQPAGLALVVRPAFYEMPLFYGLVTAVAALFAAGAVRLRGRQLRERERRLREQVEQRTSELRITSQHLAERSRDLEHANAELERLSLVDELTRLANRRHFDARLEAEWRRAARAGTVVSLVMADIDFFKPYNDAYGHPAGDEFLRAVGAALAAAVQRAEDLVARYGGEEFAVLLPGTSAIEAEGLAERLRRAVEDLGLPHGHSAAADRLTISLGFATTHPSPHSSSSGLVDAADRALYRAKAEGRNCVRGEGRQSDLSPSAALRPAKIE